MQTHFFHSFTDLEASRIDNSKPAAPNPNMKTIQR